MNQCVCEWVNVAFSVKALEVVKKTKQKWYINIGQFAIYYNDSKEMDLNKKGDSDWDFCDPAIYPRL